MVQDFFQKGKDYDDWLIAVPISSYNNAEWLQAHHFDIEPWRKRIKMFLDEGKGLV